MPSNSLCPIIPVSTGNPTRLTCDTCVRTREGEERRTFEIKIIFLSMTDEKKSRIHTCEENPHTHTPARDQHQENKLTLIA